MSHPCFCAYNRTMDLRTPRNVKLTAFFRRSFAFRTVRDRLPILLTKIIDNLTQYKDDIAKEYGIEAKEDIKAVIGKVSRLKYEIQTNKPLKNIKSRAPDAAIYNECIREKDGQEGAPTPFHTDWLLVECYMYRKVWEAFEKTKYLKQFDPFRFNKEHLFQSALPQIKEIILYLQQISENPSPKKDDFLLLLQLNLWSNKCDSSLYPEGIRPILKDQIGALAEKIIVNDSEKVWNILQNSNGDTIDMVLDNAGGELVADLALADYLTSTGICKMVNFHVKKLPWFMSDCTMSDLKWTVDQLGKMYDNTDVQSAGDSWTKNFESQKWKIKTSDFWTLPVEFAMMHKYDRNLYADLESSKLLFLKGDLNYRKTFGEVYHNPTVSLADAQGFFAPCKMCIIRVLKSEIICGFPTGLEDEYEKQDRKWREIGEYAVIQYTDKSVPLLIEEELDKLSVYRLQQEDSNISGYMTMTEPTTECLCRN